MTTEKAREELCKLLERRHINTSFEEILMAWHLAHSRREVSREEIARTIERNRHQAADGTPHFTSVGRCFGCENGLDDLLTLLNGKEEPSKIWCKDIYWDGEWFLRPTTGTELMHNLRMNPGPAREFCPICGAKRP